MALTDEGHPNSKTRSKTNRVVEPAVSAACREDFLNAAMAAIENRRLTQPPLQKNLASSTGGRSQVHNSTLLVSRLQSAQTRGEVVIDLVVAQVLFELAQTGVAVNNRTFDSGDFREILHMLGGDRVTEAGVMGSAGMDPRCTGGLEIRTAFPNGTGDGELW